MHDSTLSAARPGGHDEIALLPAGHCLHRYRIEGVLGRGGFGVTYLATDTRLKRRVALKEYLPAGLAARAASDYRLRPAPGERGARCRAGMARFITEARTLARFCHPGIVQVYNVFKANDTAYIAMQYRRGRSLEDLLLAGRHRDEQALLAMLWPLLESLERVHGAGYVHRDIKPGNIYVCQRGGPLLLDFGCARPASQDEERICELSPGYAPYEQYRACGQGPWTDIYGLGATLYEAVTGSAPPDVLTRGPAILNGRDDPLVPAARLGRGRYSRRFLKAIDAALGFRPEERPQSIAEWRSLFVGHALGWPDWRGWLARLNRARSGAVRRPAGAPAAPKAPPSAANEAARRPPEAAPPGAAVWIPRADPSGNGRARATLMRELPSQRRNATQPWPWPQAAADPTDQSGELAAAAG